LHIMHDRRRSHAFARSIKPVGTHDIRRTQKRTISADLETSAFAVERIQTFARLEEKCRIVRDVYLATYSWK